ncbi:hypothetical protein [Shewanella ulleungensis]|jgi:hypothetical protein|uniref:GRAM domain-containing protein n=1 Tax=Shewanella ulleungensis TaxID=2282699 RepID=A0ABQ2QDI8_9GAMM|nr:hypothetical protein [Shewanella ulleungensis]MCL1148916.1 hypothetical protein [Shewanella ulleungensis]GGP74791.1 hypothetical protein GCM10009410_03370 [Shewanella ulleungensis]
MSSEIIKSSFTAVQIGVARSDGKLHLTQSTIIFEPFNKAQGLGPYTLIRDDIDSVTRCMGKGGGIMPVTADAIRITLKSKQVYEFIIAEPNQWIAALSRPLN